MLSFYFYQNRILFVRTFVCVLLVLLFWACRTTEPIVEVKPTFSEDQYPKNIILMIGDGMGLAQVTAAMYATKRKLALEQFPVIGFHKPYSTNDLKTDSAAGATAFACGVKTFNGAIGMGADTLPCKTILEEAEEYGLATGLIATSQITHATPAAFIAHQPLRILFEEIAKDFLDTEIDLIIGGGQRYFDYRASDGLNLLKMMKYNNYKVTSFFEGDLASFKLDYSKNFAHFTSNDKPLPVSMGRTYLPYASKIAPAFLDQRSDKGFFLMIEGSQIDWAGHSNAGDLLINEILDFDKAIEEVLKFANEDKETLVIVTGDHETGGLAINEKSKMRNLKLKFTTNDHTGTMVPVYAYGPQADLFAGIYENTAIYDKMIQALQFSQRRTREKTASTNTSEY